MAKPSIWNFLRDPESQRSVGNGLLDAANRGMVANSLGSLVDLSTNVANLGIAGAGYIGHKTGLLSQPPELIDSRNVPGSSEWIGQKMQNAGMVSPNRNALAELGMGLLSPVAYKGAQRVGGLLYNVEQNALANLAKPSTMTMQGQRGIFAGEWAQTADKAKLKAAQELDAKKSDHRAIWDQTGWFKGADGKWRFEIDDSSAKLTLGRVAPDAYGAIEAKTFEGAMKHQKLKRAYPELNEVTFNHWPDEGYQGANFNPAENVITLGHEAMRSDRGAALHELQHAIQRREGFAQGGNQSMFPDAETLSAAQLLARRMERGDAPSVAAAWMRKNTSMNPSPQAFDLAMGDKGYLRKLGSSPFDAYKRLAGEAEARAVEARMKFTPEQRRATFPLDSYDVPLDSLIIKY